jgi:Family of unknown function (DUF6314)
MSLAASTTSVQPVELLGRWALRRRVRDEVSGLTGRVFGTLELRADGAEVRWLESGTFTWAGGQTAVSRELRIRPDADRWLVCFADGREFHPWQPGRPVLHPCRADTYRGLVVVDSDRRRLRVAWDVTGPAKQQRLISRCLRL